MRRLVWIVFVLWAVSAAPCLAGIELILEDGQKLTGVEIEMQDGLYILELVTGDLLPIPAELVETMRLTGDDAPAPSGMRVTEAQTLVGPETVVLPRISEQLQVMQGSRSIWRRNLIDPIWRPTSDWNMSPSMNNFNPSHWYQAPIDSTWTPTSAFKASGDVTNFNPVHWYQAPIDPTWYPSDGFRRD